MVSAGNNGYHVQVILQIPIPIPVPSRPPFRIACALAILFAGMLPSSAQAFNLSVFAGVDFTNYQYSSPPAGLTQTEHVGLAFGTLAGFEINELFEIETGLIFALKQPEETLPGSASQTAALRAFELPVLGRYNPIPWISLGAGLYYTEGFDPVNTSVSTFASGEPGYADTNTSKVDYGVIGSVQFRQVLSYEFRALLDVRYLYGLNNVDQQSVSGPRYFRDLQLVLGISVGRFK
jgi:hypothetical protein